MSLDEYRQKRDFSTSPEPEGTVGSADSRRFVVQRHQARSLHYDFRLELGGVLRSWAVPKGPPEEIGVRRLAIEVEDHPIDYIDFQGVIPDGYGAGSVEIWDSGSFELYEDIPGKLWFKLSGQRLSGPYVLLQTGTAKNWLLMKVRKARQPNE